MRDGCPCCGGKDSTAHAAVESPFVAERALLRKAEMTRLRECSACGFRWFERGYDAEESARLYAGYRGEDYLADRRRHEHWYTRGVNADIGSDPQEIAHRQERLLAFLKARLDLGAVGSVLDLGGDRGQFIPPSLGRERYVYEISGIEPVPGVTRLEGPESLKGRRFDVVLVAHVLEHVSEPLSLLEQAASLCAPGGALVIELPQERYGLGWVPREGGTWDPVYRTWLGWLMRHPLIFAAADLVSTFVRLKLGRIPPLGLLKQSEHINFFEPRSLEALLARCSFKAESFVRLPERRFAGFSAVLMCLGRPR